MEYRMTRLRQMIVLMMERMKMEALGLELYLLSAILSKEKLGYAKKNRQNLLQRCASSNNGKYHDAAAIYTFPFGFNLFISKD
jgi:hypothetical protein